MFFPADCLHADQKSGDPVAEAFDVPQNFCFIDSCDQFIAAFKKSAQTFPLFYPFIRQKKDSLFLLLLTGKPEIPLPVLLF